MLSTFAISLGATCLNAGLRAWLSEPKDSFLKDTLIDVTKLAEKIGCQGLEKNILNTNVNTFIDGFAEKLMNSRLMDGIDETRKEEIIQHVIQDVNSFANSGEDALDAILTERDIKEIILSGKREEIESWDEKEVGIYNNCLRFVADATKDFLQDLPAFSVHSMKFLCQRGAEAFCNQDKKLEMIISLIKRSQNTSIAFADFETDYRRKIIGEYKKVELFGAGVISRTYRRYDITTSYIQLSCTEEEYQEKNIQVSDVFNKGRIVWLEGEAGGGKTTFVQWLAVQTASSEWIGCEELVPIVIKLRNIINYPIRIEKIIRDNLGLEPPDGWIDHLIESDRILLLIDGMDEIPSGRVTEVYSFIEKIDESLHDTKRGKDDSDIRSKILITARPYVKDILGKRHSKYKVLRMDSSNIGKFVKLWNNTIGKEIEEDKTETDRISEKLISAINKSHAIKSIAGTPLLCAMICALNRSTSEAIPTDKYTLYEKCCEMFIDDRERERGIKVSENEEINSLDYTKKAVLLEEIALHMLRRQSAEVDKSEIVDYLKSFLKSGTLIESFSIKENPEILVDYLTHRLALLREPTTGKIDFIHKSFMEFLGAKALDDSSYNSEIIKNAIVPFWKETIIMSFYKMKRDRTVQILCELIRRYRKYNNNEFVFMASLCSNNTSNTDEKIKLEIQDEIKKLIPPQTEYIDYLSSAGGYIIPFLGDRLDYSDKDRDNCIKLVQEIIYEYGLEDKELVEEVVQTLLSYIRGNGSFKIKRKAAYTLAELTEDDIRENSLREEFSKDIANTCAGVEELEITSDMLYLMAYSPSLYKGFFSELKELKLYNTYHNSCIKRPKGTRVYSYFENLEKLTLVDACSNYDFRILKKTPNLYSLELLNCPENMLMNIKKIEQFAQIKELKYHSTHDDFVCRKDFEVFENIERLYLEYTDIDAEFAMDGWSFWKNLKEVIIEARGNTYDQVRTSIQIWERKNRDVNFELLMG